MGPEMNYLLEKPFDPLSLDVYLDQNGRAEGRYYEDDGVTLAYEKGVYRRTLIHAERGAGGLVITFAPLDGKQDPKGREIIMRVRPLQDVQTLRLDGRPLVRLRPSEVGPGWWKEPGAVVVRLSDDGLPHKVEVR